MDFTERLELYLEGGMINENDVRDINNIIELFKNEYGVELTEENASTFIAHLCAAYGRNVTGEEVEPLPEAVAAELQSLASYPLSLEILRKVMEVTENKLNKTEQDYALLHINNLISTLHEEGIDLQQDKDNKKGDYIGG